MEAAGHTPAAVVARLRALAAVAAKLADDPRRREVDRQDEHHAQPEQPAVGVQQARQQRQAEVGDAGREAADLGWWCLVLEVYTCDNDDDEEESQALLGAFLLRSSYRAGAGGETVRCQKYWHRVCAH